MERIVQGPARHLRRVRPKYRRLVVLFSVVLLVIVATVAVAVVRSVPPQDGGSAAAAGLPTAPVAAAPGKLQDSVESILGKAADLRVGVALADVSGGAERAFGDAGPFVAASTAKIITATAYYHLVETGKASMDALMGNYDAAFQLKAMINQSNNDSWLLLMEAVGYRSLADYAASIGVTYDPQENLLTAADMALVLKRLYAGELLNADHTRQLLGYMQQTNDEELIPAGSRNGVEVHHKYGELSGEVHDAALLTYHNATFALVIYTENPGGDEDPRQAEVIRELTGAVEDALFPALPAGK